MPDSDDEDDPLPTPTATTAQYRIGHATLNASFISPRGVEGLTLVRDALSPSKSVSNPQEHDEDDSPLSSPPESIQSDGFESLEKIVFAGSHENKYPIHNSRDEASLDRQDTNAVAVDLPLASTFSRSFRARTAIQQNPYTLERARYIVTCDERNIEPLRYREGSLELGMGHHDQETQDVEFAGSISPLNESPDDFMEVDTLAESFNTNGCSTSGTRSRHESKDDRDHKTRRRNSGTLDEAQDRRGADPPLVRTLASGFHLFDLSDSDEERAESTTETKHDTQAHESMPTPPRTMSTDSASSGRTNAIFESSNPSPLPTPVLSSAVRLRKRPIVREESDSDVMHRHGSPAMVVSDDEEPSSGDSSPEDESQELEVMGKKVRGVLPASFWKVHKVKRRSDGRSEPKDTHDGQRMVEKGVAQRTTSGDRFGHRLLRADLSLSDEESASEDHSKNQTSLGYEIDDQASQDTGEAAEADDDDEVDYMLPPRPRRTFAITSTKKRQKRLLDHIHRGSRTGISNVDCPNPVKRPDPVARPHKRRRLYAPKRTIQVLDGPDFGPGPVTPRPIFLNVAGRQARNRKVTTGLAARQKVFRFDDSQDDADVEAEIKRWEVVHNHATLAAPVDERIPHVVKTSEQSVLRSTKSLRLPGIEPRKTKTVDRQPQSFGKPPTDSSDRQQSLDGMDYPLRITQLRALLPSMNRSGLGRLATRIDTFRVGQLEEIRQTYNRILDRKRRLVVAPHGELEKADEPLASNAELMDRRSHNPLTKHKRRKQQPQEGLRCTKVDSPAIAREESVDYMRLYSQENTMTGRMRVITQWHSRYQTSWFHGRDKEGRFRISETTTAAYRHFLAVLRQFLMDTLQAMEDPDDTKVLRHFIHRLIPNRQRIGKANDVGNQMVKLRVDDAIVTKNIFELYVCFYSTVPMLAPRPRVLEYNVDFVSAHDMICTIAFEAWTKLFDLHLTDATLLEDLGNWLHTMLTQLGTRWDSAEAAARTEAASAAGRVPESIIRKAIDRNRRGVVDLAQPLFERLVTISCLALTESEWSSIFGTQQHLILADLAIKLTSTSTHTSQLLLGLLLTVTNRASAALNELLDCIRRILSSMFGSGDGGDLNLLRPAVMCYFNIAHQLVRRRARSWDHFLSPTSSLALDMLLDGQYLEQAKSLFYHLFIEADVEQYRMEFRPQVLTHWTRAILVRLTDGDPCVELTESIYKYENASLRLHELAGRLKYGGARPTTARLADILSEHRSDIIRHIVQNLSAQEADPEALFLAGGLDEADAISMLRTIFSSMKTTWISLSAAPEEQAVYTSLIWSVLDEYRTHSRSDFTVDAWFCNATTFPQKPTSTLELALRIRSVALENKAVNLGDLLRQEVNAADRSGSLNALAATLRTLLLPTFRDKLTTDEQIAETLSKHAKLIRHFAEYVYNAVHRPLIANLFLSTLIYVLNRLEVRVDQLNTQTIVLFLQACTELLPAMQHALCVYINDNNVEATETRSKIYQLTSLIFAWSTKSLDLLVDEGCLDRTIKATEEICELGANEDGPAADEAVKLLKTVMSCALSGETELAESLAMSFEGDPTNY